MHSVFKTIFLCLGTVALYAITASRLICFHGLWFYDGRTHYPGTFFFPEKKRSLVLPTKSPVKRPKEVSFGITRIYFLQLPILSTTEKKKLGELIVWARIRTWTRGFVARRANHLATEALCVNYHIIHEYNENNVWVQFARLS